MKKMDYMAPEMEVLEVKYNKILMASGEFPGLGEEIPGEGPEE